jgi:hypothetical protein
LAQLSAGYFGLCWLAACSCTAMLLLLLLLLLLLRTRIGVLALQVWVC